MVEISPGTPGVRQWTCEGYLFNSVRPISYLGVIWELYVLGLKSEVFVKKANKVLKETHPLLISADFLKYPFQQLFPTGIKFQ